MMEHLNMCDCQQKPCDKRCPKYHECKEENRQARKNYKAEGVTNLQAAFCKQLFAELNNASKEKKESLERYIKSTNFSNFTGLDGSVILEKLKRMEVE